MIDLGHWSNEEYSIGGEKQSQYDEDSSDF